MKKLLWKRRIATLLVMCMVVMQMAVPVSAQGGSSPRVAETVEVPAEYETLTLGNDEEVVDLSEKTQQEGEQETAADDALMESIKAYGSIPVVQKQAEDVQEEPVVEEPKAQTVEKVKMAVEEEEVCLETASEIADTLSLGNKQMVHVAIPYEVTTYAFTPEKDGEYDISMWTSGVGIQTQMNLSDEEGAIYFYGYDEHVQKSYLSAGKTYYINVTAYEQGYCYIMVSEPEAIFEDALNSENMVSINSVGTILIDPEEEEVVLAKIKVQSATDYFAVDAFGNLLTPTASGEYQFYVASDTKFCLINKGESTMWADIDMSKTPVQEVTMGEDETQVSHVMSPICEGAYNWRYYYTFVPQESGVYVFFADSGVGYWTIEKKETEGYYTAVANGSEFAYADLIAGDTYRVCMTSLSEGTAYVEKMDKQTLTLGQESANIFSTVFAYFEMPDMKECGVYELKLSGDLDIWQYNTAMYQNFSVNAKNGGIKTFYWSANEGEKRIVIYTPNKTKALGNLTVSLEKKDVSMSFDTENCARKAVTLFEYDETWTSFVPLSSGEYVIGTEEKAGDFIYGHIYEQVEGGQIYEVESHSTYDNINMHVSLEAGKIYYFSATSYSAEQDNANVVIYPVNEVDYSGTGEVKSDIRKAVTYTMNVPKAGFYKMNVNGTDESYFIDIEDEYGNNYLNNSFVYKDIPRIYQFERAGTYKIHVTKELMSDMKDRIIFSCTGDAALQVLNGTDQATVDVDNTDGVWIEYTPQESGWYTFDINQKRNKFRIALSIESEDGTEIVYEDSHDYYTTSGVTSYVYYLTAGRKCYYKIYPRTETTGTVTVKMSTVSESITAGVDGLPEIAPSSRLLILKTNFNEKQYTKIAVNDDIRIKEITEGTNDYFRSVYNNNIVLFPTGAREYLLYFPKAEETGNVVFNDWQSEEITNSKIVVEDTKSYTTKWAKFVPEESGLYSLVMKSKTPNNSDLESYVELYTEAERNLQYADTIFEGTAFLTAGETYFYQINLDYYGEEVQGVSAEYVLEKIEMQDETFGMGTNTIAMENVWMGPVEAVDGKYLTMTAENPNETYHFRWYVWYEDMQYYEYVTGCTVKGSMNDVRFREGCFDSYNQNNAELFVIITKDTYCEEKVDTTFTLKETEIISRELKDGDVINEPASTAIKEYTFTADSSRFAFLLDEDVFVYNITCLDDTNEDDYVESDSEWLSKEEKSCYVVYTNPGKTYKMMIANQFAYSLQKVDPKMIAAYDYDEYEAYIASGGTINLVDKVSDDMWEKIEEEGTVDYDYNWLTGKYVLKDSSNFKNKSDIWWPAYLYKDNVMDGVLEKTYYDISERIEGYIGYGRYLTKGLYSIGTSSSTTPKEVKTTDKTPGNEILLHLREPANVLIQQITLTGTTAMEVGQTAKLTAETSTLNKYSPTKPGVTFASSNSKVVSVDAQGNVTAKAAGTAVITCTSVDGNAKQSITITVKQNIITAESVTITGASQVLYVGDAMALSATIGTGGKGKPTVDGVTWSSSDQGVAIVDANGKVTGIKEGTVTITAASKDGYAKGSVTISVKPVKATKIKLNESAIRMKKGTSYKWIEAMVSPENTTNKSVTWTSSNKKVATVSAKGVINAKSVGTAVITATTENGKKDTVKVTVTASNIKVKKIILDKKMTVLAGEVVRLKPEVEPVNATNSKVSYKSSNTDVATVTNAGVVSAKKPGKATITATAKDGTNKKATCVITVKEPDKPKISKIDSSKKKQATLTWKEVEGADGYMIYMSTNKKGEYELVATINKGKTTSYTVKKLKSKKKYYFKVVSFVKSGKNKVTSDDSAVKSVKIK